MKTFKSVSDVEQIRDLPIYDIVYNLIIPTILDTPDYRPEDDGYLVLIEREDVDRVLSDLDMPWRLSEVPFEVITKIDGHYYAFYLPNNQFGLGFLIPDAEWLPGELRDHLEATLEP